jgi:fatty acid desaturase
MSEPDRWEELRSVEGARRVSAALGVDVVRGWHRRNAWLDALTVAGCLAAMAGALVGVAVLPIGVAWALAAAAVPLVLFTWLSAGHDLCTHRRVGGATVSWLLSMVFAIPRFTLPSRYEHSHRLHHRYIGTPLDGERYKQGLDTVPRRWLFLTFPGAKLAPGRGADGPAFPPPPDALARRIRVETWVMRAWIAALLVGSWLWPKAVLGGFVLPVVLVGPVVNTLRVALEHSEADDENPLFLGINYRSGPILRLLSLCNVGDGHLVHHLFPNVPWYRVPAAIRAIRPLLSDAAVPERRSLVAILWGWLVLGRPHRRPWPLAKAAGR